MQRGKWLSFITGILLALILLSSQLLTSCTATSSPATSSAPPKTTAPIVTSAPAQTSSPSTGNITQTQTPLNQGGTFTVIITKSPVQFGYPPKIAGPDKDCTPPLLERLVAVGEDGKYKPVLATSWDTAADGKSISFKLRQGVKFHDGTEFNAQAVKFNFDALIPPNPAILRGVTSVDVVDSYTVKVNLSEYNNLIFYQIALSAACYIVSPTSIQKNGVEWALTHPVGTGPFKLDKFEANNFVTLVKNPDYWEKGLPYLDKIQINTVAESMTQMVSFKAGQADTIYDASPTIAAQLRDGGWPQLKASASLITMSFDTKNNKILANPKVRQAIEYAIDKEAICNGPGLGANIPIYQVVETSSPSYNKSCPPRKYDPVKAKSLLAEAGYPNGFSFKMSWLQTDFMKDGLVAVQSYLANVGITMDITYVNQAANTNIRMGKIESGTASFTSMEAYSNTLYNMDAYFRSDANQYQYIVRPKGTDDLINKAQTLRDQDSVVPVMQEVVKLIYDDTTVVPLWTNSKLIILSKSVQNGGWFIGGDFYNSEFGRRTSLKK